MAIILTSRNIRITAKDGRTAFSKRLIGRHELSMQKDGFINLNDVLFNYASRINRACPIDVYDNSEWIHVGQMDINKLEKVYTNAEEAQEVIETVVEEPIKVEEQQPIEEIASEVVEDHQEVEEAPAEVEEVQQIEEQPMEEDSEESVEESDEDESIEETEEESTEEIGAVVNNNSQYGYKKKKHRR